MEETKVLDHGYIKLIETWGSDERVIESARMSTNKGFLGWGPTGVRCPRTGCGWEGKEEQLTKTEGDPRTRCPRCGDTGQSTIHGDEKLLRFLYENAHATPFEFGGLTIEVQAPILVFREWHRHRIPFGYNEMSARYTPLPDLNYLPTVERLLINSKTNKQAGTAQGAAELTEKGAEAFREELRRVYAEQQTLYETALAMGVPKELARVHLPVGRYSRMRATGNLRGWLAFLALRMAPNAQWEIRQYANEVGKLIEAAFPRTWELFVEGRK